METDNHRANISNLRPRASQPTGRVKSETGIRVIDDGWMIRTEGIGWESVIYSDRLPILGNLIYSSSQLRRTHRALLPVNRNPTDFE